MLQKIYNMDGEFLFQEELAVLQTGTAFCHDGVLYQIAGLISTRLYVDVFVRTIDRASYLNQLNEAAR